MRRRTFVLILSGAMTSVRRLRAQQQKTMPEVGFLGNMSPGHAASFVAAFKDGLGKIGFIEGQSVAIEYRWAEGHYDRLPAFAALGAGPQDMELHPFHARRLPGNASPRAFGRYQFRPMLAATICASR
jgi:hypothetical protein